MSYVFERKSLKQYRERPHCGVNSVYLLLRPHNAVSGNWGDWVHYRCAVLNVAFWTSYLKEMAHFPERFRWPFYDIHTNNTEEVLRKGFVGHKGSFCPVVVKLYLFVQNFTGIDLFRIEMHLLVDVNGRFCISVYLIVSSLWNVSYLIELQLIKMVLKKCQ